MRSSTADPNQTPDIVVRLLRDPGEVARHSRRSGEVSYPLLSDQLRSPLWIPLVHADNFSLCPVGM